MHHPRVAGRPGEAACLCTWATWVVSLRGSPGGQCPLQAVLSTGGSVDTGTRHKPRLPGPISTSFPQAPCLGPSGPSEPATPFPNPARPRVPVHTGRQLLPTQRARRSGQAVPSWLPRRAVVWWAQRTVRAILNRHGASLSPHHWEPPQGRVWPWWVMGSGPPARVALGPCVSLGPGGPCHLTLDPR